ncbi:hypothetical protein [Haloarchaeobius sp. HME9146]|uniref:DUF7284 family protein n=1 Tax=Haloarchaeobius sp. HME9146 TaxID=2978732 RepID=UPI0021C0C5A7|nr:hypothetical protein [Haloarchaeobius sp. HME9146]MCT9095825.1 hypothetical protein [Haloarchaeobius sp. HME9146]
MRPGEQSRGVSTVLDVTLCLLLVSASVLVVVTAERPDRSDATGADHAVELLGATTATVEYSLAPGARRADQSLVSFPDTEGEAFDRQSHGSLADLLARAAIANATVDGQPISHAGNEFERAVANTTHRRLGGLDHDWQVVATWEPTGEGPVRGQVTVGDTPPASTDVHAASVRVAVGPVVDTSAPDDWNDLAYRTASCTIGTLFPPDRGHLALLGDYPGDRLTAYRYRRAAGFLGTDLDGTLDEAAAHRANQRLTAALAGRVEPALRSRYDSPATAADAIAPGTVVVTVRTWSA